MAKFIIKCPACDTVNTVRTGFLARKTSKCGHCGLEINIKDSRMISKRCPNCGAHTDEGDSFCRNCGHKL